MSVQQSINGDIMIFLLKEITVQQQSSVVGVIVAETPETAAKKVNRTVQGEASGPRGQRYFDLTGETGKVPYLTMNSMPEINSWQELVAILE